MNWLKKLLGIKSKEEKQQQKVKDLLQKSFEAQRAGDMEMAGVYQKQADETHGKLPTTQRSHRSRRKNER
jgi:3-hydroxyacyl-CoA dehydrogenase